jgi:pyrophosphatase PpaX
MDQYDVYLFDWDGALADSTSLWVTAIRHQFDQLNLHPSDREIISALGDWKNMLPLGVKEKQLQQFRAAARAETLANLPDSPLFAGVPEMLTRLKRQQKKLAIVTAMHATTIEAMLKHHRYETFFDVIVSSSDVRNLKPHPQALLLALKRLDRKPDGTVLMLGDTSRDILAAQAAGVDSLLFYPPEHQTFHDLEELRGHEPTYIIRDWKELFAK